MSVWWPVILYAVAAIAFGAGVLTAAICKSNGGDDNGRGDE